MKQHPSPPKSFLRFFRWFCHPKLKDSIEGDLMELYDERVKEFGKRKADRKFIVDVLLLFRPGIFKPTRGFNINRYDMIKSHFSIGFRNIIRKKVDTAINVLGLSLGICGSIIIYLIAHHELSFERFHPHHERTYRLVGDITESTGDQLHFVKIPIPSTSVVRDGLIGIDVAAGLIPYNVKITIPNARDSSKEFGSTLNGTNYITTAITEPQFFDVFKYEWLAGDEFTALARPNALVLTESRASLYFGKQPINKIIGRQVVYDDSLVVTVSGVIKEWSENSDLMFTDFISAATLQTSYLKTKIVANSWKQQDMASWGFIRLSRDSKPEPINPQLTALAKKHGDPDTKLNLHIEPISQIHFNADIIENPIRTAHLPTLYTLIGIALFILILAVVNYIIISTAQSIRRAKEVGIRKVLGSDKGNLILQFLTETFLVTTLSVALAVTLVAPILNQFRSFIPQGVSFHFLEPTFILFLIAITLVTALSAGFYPAIVLTTYLPAISLKGLGWKDAGSKLNLKKGLVVFQFAVSLVFIISSLIIANQLKYARDKDLGFKSDAILIVDGGRGESASKLKVLAQELKRIANVENVARQWLSPMTDNPRGMKLKTKSTDAKDFWVRQIAGDEEFIPLYQIKLLAGRNLAPSDTAKEFVINESLSRLIGNVKAEEAIGDILYWNDKPYPVVGVVSDFHTKSLHEPIDFLCVVNRPDREFSLAIKLASTGKQAGSVGATIEQIKKEWKAIYPASTFQYRFYDDSLALLYEKDRQTATLMNTSTAIAVFISCMGLLGLTLFTTENRSKEIGIRKVLGARIIDIVILLSREITWLVVVALLIASPVAWYFMNQWLLRFSYHITMSGWTFVMAGLMAIFIAFGTVSFLALRAALENPVAKLKSE